MPKYVKHDIKRKFVYPTPLDIINGAPYYNLADMPPTANSGYCIVSIGNSGTSMLIKALAYMSGNPVHASHSQYKSHTQFLLRNTNIKVIVIIRDPRDYILSRMGVRGQRVNINEPTDIVDGWGEASAFQSLDEFNEFLPKFKKLSILSRIKLQLTDEQMPPFGNTSILYKTMMQFAERENTMFVRFEDLISLDILESGVSSREKTLIDIGNFLQLPLNDEIITKVADELVGGTVNYNPNLEKVGYWKIHYTPELIDLFKTTYLQEILMKFKYEQDSTWGLTCEDTSASSASVSSILTVTPIFKMQS